MSGFPALPPLYLSNVYNPNNFIQPSSSLTLEQANSLYLSLSGGVVTGLATFNASLAINGTITFNGSVLNLSSITGITNGVAAFNKALVLDSSGNIATINQLTSTTLITTNLTLGGISISSTGTQINYTNVTAGTASASKCLVLDSSSNITGINSLTATTLTAISTVTGGLTLGGVSISSTGAQINYLEPIITLGVGAASGCLTLNSSSNITSGINSLTATTLISTNSTLTNSTITNATINNITLGSTLITSTGTQLNYTNVTAGTASASKCLVLDSSSNITGINSITTTSLVSNYIYNSISITTTNLILTNLAANSGSIYTQSNFGIYTSTANRSLCINDYAGNCMRLIYNNNSGTETNYVDLKVSSSGSFIMAPSGNIAQINGDLIVTTYCTIGSASLQSYPLYVNGSVSYSVGNVTSYSLSGYGVSTGAGTTIGPATNSTSLYTTNGIVVASGQVWYLSDRRIKKEIHHLRDDYGVNLINNITLVEYKLIKDKNNTPNIGVIAQDLLELNYKEFVNFTQNDEMDDGIQYGVDYTKLCIPIISYIKKLNKKNIELESKIKFLQDTFINLYPDMKGQF